MLSDDSDPSEVRRSRAYRLALWLTRLCFGWVLVWVVAINFFQPSARVVLLIVLPAFALSWTAFALIHLFGTRVTAGRFYRDLLWLPRRKP